VHAVGVDPVLLRRDLATTGFKVIGHLGVFGKHRRCVVSVHARPEVYYKRRTLHWTKAAIFMKAPPGAFWGSGGDPAGWACHGQGSHELSCVRSSAVKA
jgi:hypothetical protein